jgi:superfamily II DNA or RNA helicase
MRLSEDVVINTVNLLSITYKFPTQFINKMIEEFGLNDCEITLNKRLSNNEKLKLILNAQGSMLFAGSNDINTEIRKRIIENWSVSNVNECFDKWGKSMGNSKAHKVGKLANLKWHSGKQWANKFVEISDFDKVFTGIANDSKKSKFEDIEPIIKPPELISFQIELKDALIKTLNEKGDEAKCVISLPTGGGKTRTAVEAFVQWLQPRFAEGKYLIWLAQSEELCEQAIASISQVWSSKEFTDSLRVYRFYGSNEFNSDDLCGGVVVCTIQKIYNAILKDSDVIHEIISNCGALLIDEAHRSTSPMYLKLYEYAQQLNGEPMFPICGLTATPGRNGETYKLSELFQSNLYTPNLGEEYNKNPLAYFRNNKYLAVPIHKIVNTNCNIDDLKIDENLNDEEIKEELEKYFKKTLNKKLASDINRNLKIVSTLQQIKKGKQTLVYSCTVDHAIYLATMMNFLGRSAVVVSSDTRKPLRRKYIEQFKNGEIEFIFNYGVLTTGFDAPKTENIVICRPTFSDVLYEQIVGRGLRGPKFGGTETCTIIDFCDNFYRFGDQQAYMRFKDLWFK